MKILLLSNSRYNSDGRLKELNKLCQRVDETILIDKSRGFLEMLKKLLFLKKIDILFIDNRAIIPIALLFCFFKRPRYIVQDCREMYFCREQKHLKSKIGCFFEYIMLKKVNIIIVANKYRARIMKKAYNLDKKILIFENIRNFDDQKYEEMILEIKYEKLLERNTFKIISTSGYTGNSLDKNLIKFIEKAEGNYELFFVGKINKLKKIEQKNIHYIDKIPFSELRFLLNKMNVGYVGYEIINLNTKYCASGKIYEYLNENLPILSHKNIPLKNFIKKYNVGVSGDNINELIKRLEQNPEFYKENILQFKKLNKKRIEENFIKVIQGIKEEIK